MMLTNKEKKYSKIILFLVIYFIVSPVLAEEPIFTKLPPYPREILLPEIRLADSPDSPAKEKYEFNKTNYHIIFVISSWNESSKKIAKLLDFYFTKLQERNIKVLGLFSHDQVAETLKWRSEVKPTFPVHFAELKWLESLNNPKIPTVWLLAPRGKIIKVLEMPRIEQVEELVLEIIKLRSF